MKLKHSFLIIHKVYWIAYISIPELYISATNRATCPQPKPSASCITVPSKGLRGAVRNAHTTPRPSPKPRGEDPLFKGDSSCLPPSRGEGQPEFPPKRAPRAPTPHYEKSKDNILPRLRPLPQFKQQPAQWIVYCLWASHNEAETKFKFVCDIFPLLPTPHTGPYCSTARGLC